MLSSWQKRRRTQITPHDARLSDKSGTMNIKKCVMGSWSVMVVVVVELMVAVMGWCLTMVALGKGDGDGVISIPHSVLQSHNALFHAEP